METKFIPIDYDYFDFQGKNYVKIVGRDDKGKRVCVIDSCPVYLWAILEENLDENKIEKLISKIEKIKLSTKGRNTEVEKVEVHNKKFLDKKVKALKIFATNYKDLHDIADRLDFPEIKKRRGYDLGFTTHYIIEKKLYPLQWHNVKGEILNNSFEFGGIDMALETDFCIKLDSIEKLDSKENFTPKNLAYDIETDALEIGEGEILMISLYSKNFKKVLTWKKDPSEKTSDLNYVEYVKDEAELIEKFIETVKKFSPDFLIGYFSDGFDLPYLKARAEKLKVKLSLGLDESKPKFSRGGAGIVGKIFGITHIDIFKFIKTTYSQYLKSETLTLNEVAKEFLGDTKKDFKIKHSSKLKTDQHWKEYYEYNLQDSNLTLKLFEKLWPDIMEFAKVIKEPPFEISRNGLSKQVESYILHNLERFNEIPEKRPGHDEIIKRKYREKVEGAFVLEPKPGLYKNLAMFDFTSMHTSIIISMNISRSTLIVPESVKEVPKNSNHIQTKMGELYFSKKIGFFPELLNDIFQKRKTFKKEFQKSPNPITKARSNAFKLLSASAHGYIGFFGSRYYSLESSAAILAFVRKFNKETIENVSKEGFKVIYGDTDSVAFTREGKSKTEIKNFLEKLNKKLPGIMELELDGFFKRGIWVTTRSGTVGAKKKYALISEDGKMKIRGFETVRRDWCQLARKLQNKIIELILNDGNEKRALEYLKKTITKLKNREIKQEEMIIRTQLKKPISEYKSISPHVVAAKKMKEMDLPVSQGNLVEYYIAETAEKKKLVREKVKLPQEKGEYNKEYYLEKQVLPAVENIFQVFDFDVKTLINKKNQMTLEGF